MYDEKYEYEQEKLLQAYNEVFANPSGKIVLEDLEELSQAKTAKENRTTYRGPASFTDMVFLEGMQCLYGHILCKLAKYQKQR